MTTESLRERVLSRLIIDPETGCVLWTGSLSVDGYGKVAYRQRTLAVHRLMYEWFAGPIPPGMQIDHVKAWGCTNRHCASPAHLEAVTPRENTLRADGPAGINSRVTSCGTCGTPYDEVNTYLTPSGRRDCRTCRRAADRRCQRTPKDRRAYLREWRLRRRIAPAPVAGRDPAGGAP